ncbi:MAG: hypothetical protein Q8J84_09945 [Flavobacteriaceae bacterium]|nr:hypothetical protein [Flavobacteriaceae bacterium]
MKKILYFFFFVSLIAFSQQLPIEKFKGMKPRSIGPAGMSGRITAVDVVNNQPEIIYAGAASGGVWKSESGGIEWEPIFDKQPIQAIGAITIQQSNPDVIWVGTGEGNPRNSLNGGYGIYKSLDGGKNWQLMGLEKTRNIHRIIIDRDNPNTVYVAAIGSPWGEHPERGVFKTTDGGKTWEKILFVNNRTGAADLVVDSSNPNKLIAAMWEHKRDPWFFKSGGEGSGIYISYDGGKNWSKKTEDDGLPKGNLGRTGLAISASNPKIVYALVEAEKNGLYKSEDGGFKWKKVNDSDNINNRPFYYAEIYVDPLNENRLYSIHTYVTVSIDGGKSFEELMPAYNTSKGVHPDHHAWWIHPSNPNYIIDGNDGGLNISHDRGKTWRFVENLPVGQFYHINVDNEFPYNVYGGMQDNGSWFGPSSVLKDQGIRNSYWQEVMFGDGFDVVPDLKDNRYGYAMSQGGNVGRFDKLTGNVKNIKPTHPDLKMKLRFNWNSAIAIDPFDGETVYFGSQFVHKSTNKGHEWKIISPDLTTDNPEKQKQHESGGLTMDATGAENHCTILAITPSTLEKGLIWIGTDDGNVQITRNGGETWTNLSQNIKGMPAGSWVAQIKASTFNPAEAFVVVNNYRNFDFKPYLFRTRDYGKTWESLLDKKEETFGYTLSLVQDTEAKNLLFLGTEYGLYFSIDEGKNWTKWTEDYPSVPTMDLVIHPTQHDLVIGTFGRSFWILDDIRPLRELAKTGVTLLTKSLKIFEPNKAFITEKQQPTGTRFGANAVYNGENKRDGAMISYLFNKPIEIKESKKETKETVKSTSDSKQKNDSIMVTVYNQENKLIRTLKQKTPTENGIHRMYWGLDEKGVNRPSRSSSQRGRNFEPRGVTVLPGTYKLVLSFGKEKDSTVISVKYDPRIDMTTEALEAKYQLLKDAENTMEQMANISQQLNESKEIVKQYKKQIGDLKDNKHADLLKKHDSITKQLDSFIDELLGKEDKRQGITRSPDPTIVSNLATAFSYINDLMQLPGATENQLLENAVKVFDAYKIKVNTFYKNDWVDFKNQVEKLNLSLFKESKTF